MSCPLPERLGDTLYAAAPLRRREPARARSVALVDGSGR